jgi:hypothetical protein
MKSKKDNEGNRSGIKKWIQPLNDVVTLVLAIFVILLAVNGNKLSESAYNLSVNDRNQRAQLIKLKEIVKIQHDQVDTLMEAVKELRRLNENALENNNRLNRQTKVFLLTRNRHSRLFNIR